MKPTLVRNPMWLALVMAIVLVGCEDDPTGPSATGAVTVSDFEFDPEDIVVAAGGTVTFTWASGITEPHNVTFVSGSILDSASQLTGTFAVTMPTTPGVYTYSCTNHPTVMNGSVEVQ